MNTASSSVRPDPVLILDTNHVPVLGYASEPSQRLLHKLEVAGQETATTIVCVEEQFRGWLAEIHRLADPHRQIAAYEELRRRLEFFAAWLVLPWDAAAADLFVRFRRDGIRVGTMDLKIAIVLAGPKSSRLYPDPLRRVAFYDAEHKRRLVVLTNNFDLGASTIAAIYKDRWEIEIFFKHLKQNLKIKTFVGTSPNAVKIQIWTALIAILILKFLQLRSNFTWSISNLVALLRMNLFTHRDLWAWLDKRFEVLPTLYEPEQLKLNLV